MPVNMEGRVVVEDVCGRLEGAAAAEGVACAGGRAVKDTRVPVGPGADPLGAVADPEVDAEGPRVRGRGTVRDTEAVEAEGDSTWEAVSRRGVTPFRMLAEGTVTGLHGVRKGEGGRGKGEGAERLQRPNRVPWEGRGAIGVAGLEGGGGRGRREGEERQEV